MIRQVRGLAQTGAPATKNLAKFLKSIRKTNGFKHLMKTIFGLGGAVNAFDQFGHLVRALVPLQNCFDYTSIPQSGCSANFTIAPLSAAAKERRRAEQQSESYKPGAGQSDQGSVQTDPQTAPDAAPDQPETTTPDEGTAPPAQTDPQPVAPGGPPEATSPDGQPQVEAGAARQLLRFLMGEPRHHKRGKR